MAPGEEGVDMMPADAEGGDEGTDLAALEVFGLIGAVGEPFAEEGGGGGLHGER